MRVLKLVGFTFILVLLITSCGPTWMHIDLPFHGIIEQSTQPASSYIGVQSHTTAASCSQADVQTAIDAASDGDFVLVPAGQCTWTTPGDNTPSVKLYQKEITLLGAGTNQTVITDGTAIQWNETPLRVDGAAGKPFRITGFTFIGNGQNDSFPVIDVNGESQGWRIDHIQFTDAKRAISTSGETYGVIDHCTFSNHTYDFPYQAISVSGRDEVWQKSLSLGTADAVYIEDCLFDYTKFGNTVDGHIGARFVFRHNMLQGTYIEAHGFCCNLSRGTFSYEIYANILIGSTGDWVPFSLRGGTGVVYDNIVSGDYGLPQIQIYNDRSCPNRAWQGVCDGTSPVDGNQDPSGYPCRDQIGRSTDLPDGQQAYEPLYEWNNTYNGVDMDITLNPGLCTQMSSHLVENRDFFNDTFRSGYTPYPYPHPRTKELVMSGSSADHAIHLTWDVFTFLPLASTWTIDYSGPLGDRTPPIASILADTRSYTLTGLTNYQWYTVTLTTDPPQLTDTIMILPTDHLLYIPLTLKRP